MNPTDFTAVGIDVGGTKIAAGLVKFPSGIVVFREQAPTGASSEAALESLVKLTNDLSARSRGAGLTLRGIGVGICEIVRRDGTIASNASLTWSEADLQQRLGSTAPVVIEADVRAAARAEALFGAGQNLDCFLYISIGTGISSCLVIDGQPFTGAHGATGTFASGPFPSMDPSKTGSLEEFSSGTGLRARFKASGGKAESGREVIAAAEQGNKAASEVVRSGAAALGASIGWLVNVLDPRAVILGGGLGLNRGVYYDTLIKAARKHIWWHGHREVPIVQAETGADAGLIGAAATAWSELSGDGWKASRSI